MLQPEGNLEGRGVQNPRPQEISRACIGLAGGQGKYLLNWFKKFLLEILWCKIFYLEIQLDWLSGEAGGKRGRLGNPTCQLFLRLRLNHLLGKPSNILKIWQIYREYIKDILKICIKAGENWKSYLPALPAPSPPQAHPPTENHLIYWKSDKYIENISKIYWNYIQDILKLYQRYIENLH